jgi:citrate lyase subunit beta/citryl-CoA lyase
MQANRDDPAEAAALMLRSLLFCPADSPKKLAKAAEAGADAVILDLEDSVAPERKPEARAIAAAFVGERAGGEGPELWVRINPLSTELALDDLAAFAEALPDGIVLPKPDSAEDARRLARMLDTLEPSAGAAAGAVRILPIATETPRALFRLDGYADDVPRLAGLTWGAEDLSAAVGAATNRGADGRLLDLYRLARSLTLAAAAAADVAAIETVWTDLHDLDGLAACAEQGRREGFTGMLAVHPAQVAVINRVFTPSEGERDEAARLVALFDAHPGAAALQFEGRMVDIPHLKRARRLLGR